MRLFKDKKFALILSSILVGSLFILGIIFALIFEFMPKDNDVPLRILHILYAISWGSLLFIAIPYLIFALSIKKESKD